MARNFGRILDPLTTVHGNIEHLGIWRYFLHPFAGIFEGIILIIVVAYGFAIGLYLFHLVFWTALLGVAIPILIFVTFTFFEVPAKLLGRFVHRNQERKLGWLGFILLFLACIFQLFVVLFAGH